ncbi:MAG: hypothetical protein V3U57_00245 [Robiginitomaculum sp.]
MSGISAERFQEIAFGAKQFGIDGQEVADVLKDMNDRLGDFAQTDAGPLADFFENIAPKVGLTIDSFRELSSDQALGLYIKTLEDAGVNQQDMMFYMEALAGNPTKLLPLLKNNGAAMNDLSKEARDLGLVLENGAVRQAAEADRKLEKLGATIRAGLTGAIIDLAPQIEDITDDLIALTPELVGWAEARLTGIANLIGNLERLGNAWERSPFGKCLGAALPATKGGVEKQMNEAIRLNQLLEQVSRKRKKGDSILGDRAGPYDGFNGSKRNAKSLFKSEFKDLFGKEIYSQNKKDADALKALIHDCYNQLADVLKDIEIASPTPTGLKDGERTKGRRAPLPAKERKAAEERLTKQNDALREARALFEATRTPAEEYKMILEAIATIGANCLLLDASGGFETLIRARADAIVELANATDDAEVATRALGEQVALGNIDFDTSAKVMARINDELGINEKRLQKAKDAQEEATRLSDIEKDKLLDKVDALALEAEEKLLLARLNGDTTEIEKLERELELIREKSNAIRNGAIEAEAETVAKSLVDDRDFADMKGKMRDAFKGGIRAAIDGDLGNYLADKLGSAADSMFDKALDDLFDAIFSGLSGSGGLGGLFGGGGSGGAGLGGIITSLFGFADGGLVSGSGGPRSDSLLAKLSSGEFVVNATATKANLPVLSAMNSGRDLSTAFQPTNAGPTQMVVNKYYTISGVADVAELKQIIRDGDAATLNEVPGVVSKANQRQRRASPR